MSIENGIITSAEYYDPQCREPKHGYCVHCKQLVPVDELTTFTSGDTVCNDCLHDYLELQGADFVNEYIQQNEWEFYGSWWFTGLDREEQLRVIKAGYLAENINSAQHDYLESQKVDFCKEDDGFLEFVKERLE